MESRTPAGSRHLTVALAVAICLASFALPDVAGATPESVRVTGSGNPVRWQSDHVSVNLDSSLGLLGDAVGVESMMLSALEEWRESGLLPPSLTTASSNGAEAGYNRSGPNQNDVTALAQGWPFSPEHPAVTVTTYNTGTGAILDSDVLFEAASWTWSATEAPGHDDLDLQDVATHEFGHFLGFRHSDVQEATMYSTGRYGSTSRRTLHADDLQALVVAYGSTEILGRPHAAGCSSAGDPPKSGLGLMAMVSLGLILGMVLRRRSRL